MPSNSRDLDKLKKERQKFHHWAGHSAGHRRNDRAWPDDGRDVVILRLHKKKDQYPTRVKTGDPQRGLLVIRSAFDKAGASIPAKTGDRMMLAWMDEEGEHVLPVVIAKIVPEDPPMWVVKQIGIAITKQLRRFARIRDVGRIDISMGTNFVEALRLDLSEGGMKVKIPSNVDYEEGEEVMVRTTVGKRSSGRELAGKAKVMKVFNRAGSKEIGISFIDLPESDKDFIRRYIYEKQIHEHRLRRGGDD